MLVLTRRPDESIIIRNQETHEEVEIKLIDINGRQARIGISAPQHINIVRREIDNYNA